MAASYFWAQGKSLWVCGKGATFPLEKQSAGNYIRADCVQRKHVPPELGLTGVTLCRLCTRACVCVCVLSFLRAICFIDKGRMWKKWKLPLLTHFTEAGRTAAVRSVD